MTDIFAGADPLSEEDLKAAAADPVAPVGPCGPVAPVAPGAPGVDHESPVRKLKRREVVQGSLPPHSMEAEQGVIGCIMLDPVSGPAKCTETLTAGEMVFYDLRHRMIYGHLIAMWKAGEVIDLVTIAARLKSHGQTEAVGGLAYVSGLMDSVPSAANLEYYLKILVEKHVLRSYAALSSKIAAKVNEWTGSHEEFMMWAESEVAKIRVADGSLKRQGLKDHLQDAFTRYTDAISGRGDHGIDLGLWALRRYVRGLKRGQVMLIGGRPSAGKTALAVSVGLNIAMQGKRVGVCSLESPVDEMIDRHIQAISGLSLRQADTFTQDEIRTLTVAMGTMKNLPIVIEHEPLIDVDGFASMARRMVTENGAEFLIVDYAEEIESTLPPTTPGREKMKQVARRVKAVARLLKVPVILLCQLSRDTEKSDRRPMLSDLGESGFLEKFADVIWLLWKPKSDVYEKPSVEMRTFIEKNRNGPTGQVDLLFRRYCTRYEDIPMDTGTTDD